MPRDITLITPNYPYRSAFCRPGILCVPNTIQYGRIMKHVMNCLEWLCYNLLSLISSVRDWYFGAEHYPTSIVPVIKKTRPPLFSGLRGKSPISIPYFWQCWHLSHLCGIWTKFQKLYIHIYKMFGMILWNSDEG